MSLKRKLIILLVLILLTLQTACKTVYVYPVIDEPIIGEIPTHEPWQFTAIDNSNYIISEEDLKKVVVYIKELQIAVKQRQAGLDYYKKVSKRLENKAFGIDE